MNDAMKDTLRDYVKALDESKHDIPKALEMLEELLQEVELKETGKGAK